MIAEVFDTLVWVLAVTLCVPGLRGRPGRAAAAMAVTAAMLWIPMGGSSGLAVLRGAVASPAVTTLAILAVLLVSRCGGASLFACGERVQIAALVALTGLLFYPPALGLGVVDPYAWGYGSAALPLAAGALALTCGAAGRWVLAAALTAALAAWRLKLLDSPNLWDYLIDPLLAIGGLLALALYAVRRKSAKRAGCTLAVARSAAKSGEAR
ncbi:hypothetical protein [Aromatoleum diolicum]|uniref:Uncharacterized protein n=1 Tax=Aromatoleum diolicum TaxID=75796 RepID=A0ABX1Q860_9RHOO|nr:hypothetical protein [Aromatoleum diolicum]NMG73592.1 hypothetical protein [Aromatoleum diolicum]